VYALAAIPSGARVLDYEGDALDLLAFYTRYPDGVVMEGRGSKVDNNLPLVARAAAAEPRDVTAQPPLRQPQLRTPQGNYCIGIDDEWCLDGQPRSLDTVTASGCHINHSATRFNLARRTRRAEKRVELFATRDIRCVRGSRVRVWGRDRERLCGRAARGRV